MLPHTRLAKAVILMNIFIIHCSHYLFSASADNTYLDLDYSAYHKNLIQ